jgi:pyruvate dehydrogenase E2 component (dihydrolipoamide acetyltransferase)
VVTTMIMQRMSVAMEYGVILKWLKKEGDSVKKGEPVVEIFGEKNEFDLEATADGIILKILCEENDEIPISEPIAIIGEKGEAIPDIVPKKMAQAVSTSSPPAAAPVAKVARPNQAVAVTRGKKATMEGGRLRASPRARMRANELGVDLAFVDGTGPNGRIVERDVVASQGMAQSASALISDERRVKSVETLTPLRRTIARRMTQSSQNPHITMITEIDMTEAAALRSDLNKTAEKTLGFKISFNDIILKAVADVLESFPKFNATLNGNDLHIFEDIHLGVAMATDAGLIVPVVRSANKKSITQIAQETKVLGKKAKENKLAPEELTGSTFTVSNLGPFKVDLFIPVINPPESAILALGQIKKKPVVIDDMIAIRHMMMASCAVDHRVLDGAPAGQFLQALKETLENPYMLKY